MTANYFRASCLVETRNREIQMQVGSFPAPDFATNTKSRSSPLRPSTTNSQASSSTAIHAFLCPPGHDHGFPKHGRNPTGTHLVLCYHPEEQCEELSGLGAPP